MNKVVLIERDKPVDITDGDNLLVNKCDDCSALMSYCHEEVDIHMFVHINDALTKEYGNIMIIIVDTDVLVLAISFLAQICEWNLERGLRLDKCQPHKIAASLGPSKSRVPPVLHALTECDTLSNTIAGNQH